MCLLQVQNSSLRHAMGIQSVDWSRLAKVHELVDGRPKCPFPAGTKRYRNCEAGRSLRLKEMQSCCSGFAYGMLSMGLD